MKRIIFVCTAILVMLGHVALAETGTLRISAGPSMMYDPSTQEVGAGGHVTVGYRVTPSLEVELYGAMSGDFEVDNDLTRGDAAVSFLTLGGRYVSSMGDKTSGYFALGAGALDLEADSVPAGSDDSRQGGIGRFGVGIDHAFMPNLGVTCGAGFNRGFGATNEIILYDLTLSFFLAF